MSDLISRQKVITKFNKYCTSESIDKNGIKRGEIHTAMTYEGIIKIIEALPSAEPEQKGEWLDRHAYDNADYTIDEWQSAQCSVCGKYHTTPYLYNFTVYKYCPNCGSKMTRGELMKDCTTCQHCQSCDTFFSCELHDDVEEKANQHYSGHDCDDYEESDYTMTQVWDWR